MIKREPKDVAAAALRCSSRDGRFPFPGVNAFVLHGRQMRQQRIGINSIGIFAVASKQEQRFAVQACRRVLTAKLDDIVAFALTLAGMQVGRQRCQREP